MGNFSGGKEEIAKFVGAQLMLEISMLVVRESYKIYDANCCYIFDAKVSKKVFFVILSSRKKRRRNGYIRRGF